MLSAALLLLPTSCVRKLEHIPPPEAVEVIPAFLGEASGVYRIVESTQAPEASAVGTRLLISQVNDVFVISNSSEAADEATLSVIGRADQASTDATGSCVTGEFSLSAADAGFLLTAEAHLYIGIGAVSLLTKPPPELQGLFRCPEYAPRGSDSPLLEGERRCLGDFGQDDFVAPGPICVFHLMRECDFDSNVSGVYSMQVEAVSSEGTCTHPSLAGERQWLLTTANGAADMTILGLSADGSTLELATLASWNAVSGEIELAVPLPISGRVWDTGSAFRGTLSVSGDELLYDDIDLVRVLDSCTERYRARGTRLRGAKIGTSCPAYSRFSCPMSFMECPEIPSEVGASYTFTHESMRGTNGCPVFACVATLSVDELCDAESRLIAADGCVDHSTGLLRNLSFSLEPSSSGGACTKLSCVEDETCALVDVGQLAPPAVSGLSCGPANMVALRTPGGHCITSACVQDPLSDCAPLLDCGALLAQSRPRVDGETGCSGNLCELSGKIAFSAEQVALMRSSYFEVTAVHQAAAGDKSTVELSADSSACPPVDVETTLTTCPTEAGLDYNYDICGGPGERHTLEPALYRARYGQVCIGLTEAFTGQLVSLPGAHGTPCDSTRSACCDRPTDASGAIHMGCLTPASSSQYTIMLHVQNNLGDTIEVKVENDPGSALASVNTIEQLATPGMTTMILPRSIAKLTGYGLIVTTNPPKNCKFTTSSAPFFVFSSESDATDLMILCE